LRAANADDAGCDARQGRANTLWMTGLQGPWIRGFTLPIWETSLRGACLFHHNSKAKHPHWPKFRHAQFLQMPSFRAWDRGWWRCRRYCQVD
jgi:hypothetical protein